MKMRESKGLKATASVLLAVFLSALAVGLSGLYTLLVYYRVMDADGFRNSYVIASRMNYDIDEVVRCYQYEVMEEQGIPLSSYQQRRLAEAPSHYQSAADSNFLWVIQDENGRVLRSNLTTETPLEEFERGTNSQYSETTVWWSPWEMADIVYEFRWDTEEDRQAEISETSVLWQVRYGLRDPLTADDYYAYEEEQFSRADGWLQETLIVLAVAFVACVVLFSYLAAAAGHSRGVEGIRLNFLDYIWVEVWILLVIILLSIVLGLLDPYSYSSPFIREAVAGTFFFWGLAACLLTLIRRGKAKKMYATSLVRLLLKPVRSFGRFVRRAVRHSRAVTKVLVAALLIVLFELICLEGRYSGGVMFLWVMGNVALVLLAVWIAVQYDTLRKATERMAAGELGQVVKEGDVPLFKPLAANLNHCGEALTAAVQDATRSERLKTELITNVSHDIKTPLTSIISYVDLLKTTDIQDPKALEYIAVLEKKSKRLAQLMVDLVEASKVTSGNVSVEMEPLNLGELIKQASGEFEARLEEKNIALLCRLPEEPVMVMADGRHMWRVLDNLFGNTVKYALEGTRVYVDLTVENEAAALVIKNISRDPLNIRPEELMERFVRGDQARHTEGSGLGLSIARSLMELQGGSMELAIDGDLFKVQLRMRAIGG